MNRTKPRWFKRKVLMVFGALSAIATGAFAAILITALIGGSMTVVDKPALSWSGMNAKSISTDGSGIACTPTVSNGKLNVNITDAMPGASCVIEAQTTTVADSGLVVQGVDMSGLDVELVDVAMFTGDMVCGRELPTNQGGTFRMNLTVPEDATAGVKPIAGQVSVVPEAQYDPALCTN